MKISYLLLNEIFTTSQVSKNDINGKLDNFLDICDEIVQYEDENIIYSLEIYNQNFDESDFVSWLYSFEEETTEKQLLRTLFEKDFINDDEIHEDLYSNKGFDDLGGVSLLDWPSKFPEHITPIVSVENCLEIRKKKLVKSYNTEDFAKGISKTFPNLYLSENVYKSIKHFNPINKHANELIKHLTALNNHAMDCYHTYKKSGHHDALQILKSKSKNIECSPEGDAKRVTKYLTFAFSNIYGEVKNIECSPHTKLYQSNSDYRIYFEWNDERIDGCPPILIGHIGGHPY